jgi:gliding motility-associated-like protein
MSTEMIRMTTPNSQLTTSKTALVSSSHEQFIPERMNTKSTISKRFTLLLTAILVSVTTALAQCPNPITAVTLTVNDQPCGSPAIAGSMTVAVTGGVAPYTYSWTRNGTAYVTTPANTNAPTNLISGNYIVSVTDACGVTAVQSSQVTLNNAVAIDLQNASLGVNALCFADNGSISASIFGGTSQRSLVVTNTTTNVVYTQITPSGAPVSGVYPFSINVPAGTYSVAAVDAGSTCPSETWLTNVTVGQPASALTATTAKTDVCFGGTNGTITVTAAGGTGTKTYSNDGGATFQASNIFTGLAAGTYSIVVKDANNCTTTPASVTINQSGSALAVAVTSVTNLACNGISTGAVNITATGGYSTAYTYAWTGPASFTSTTEDLAALASGTYNVTVTDAGGCTQTATATLTQPTALSASAVATNVLCFGGSTGSVNLTATGGTTPYTYSWTGPSSYTATTEDLTSRPIGTYIVTVTDGNNCTTSASASITQPSVLAATNVVTNVACNGASTGAVNLTVTGGVAPYSYAWTGPSSFTATTEDLTGRPAGAYNVTVTDANGCTTTSSATLTQPTALTASITAQANNTCFGAALGSATVTAAGGTSAYTYSWNTSPAQTTASASNLAAGTFIVTVTDANACTTTASATITQPNALTATVNKTNVLCNGAANGTITVTGAAGGTGFYQYSNNGGTTWQSSNTFNNLAPNTYNVQMRDVNAPYGTGSNAGVADPWSSTYWQSFTPTSSSLLTAIEIFITGQNGTPATVTPMTGTLNIYSGTGTGGTLLATQSISLTQTINVFNSNLLTLSTPINVNGGVVYTYEIIASANLGVLLPNFNNSNNYVGGVYGGSANHDAAFNLYTVSSSPCVVDLDGVNNTVITEPAVLAATATNTNVSCNGGSNGSVTVTATGGTAPYTYSSNGTTFQASNILTGLTAGTYNAITVKDANNCTVIISRTITQPSVLAITDDGNAPASCANTTDGAYFISVSGGTSPYTYAWSGPSGFTSTTQDQSFNLAPGTYSVVVTDANACTSTLSNLVVTSPPAINIASVATDVTCFQGTNGAINATITGGSPAFTYQWKKNGVNFATTEDLTGIGAGTYVLTVTDGNFCQNSTASIVITEGPQIVATVAANAAAICSGANAVFTITGTTGNVVTYNLNGGSNTTATIAAGTATVTVTAATTAQTLNLVSVSNGACSNTLSGTAAVTINALPTANAGADQTVCAGASVTLSGAGTGTYSWNNSVSNGVAFTAVNATTAAITTTYTLTVTNANGCTATDQVNVTVNPSPIITAINNQTVCNGSQTTAVTFADNLTGTTYAWTNNTASIGLAASGTGNIAAFTATNTGTAPVTATVSVTGTNAGCTSAPVTFTISVNPTPTVDNFTAQTVCAGSSNAAVVPAGTVTGTNYAWTNTNTTIGLAASGTGTIPSFTAVNAGATAVTSTVTVTPSYGGNMGTVFGETAQGNSLILNAPAGTYFTGVQFASYGTPTGSLGNYTIGSCHNANSAATVSNLALGQTTVTIPATDAVFGATCGTTPKTLAVVLTYGTFGSACSGTAKTYTITVNPTPVVANKTATICSGSAFTATTGGSDVVPAGTQYTWTVAANANVTGASNQSTATSTISQTLTNTSNTVQTVVYTVTPISGTCSGATFTVTVTVNPTPALTSTLTPSALCAPNFFSYTAVSPTVAATGSTVLSWARQANVGIHEAPTSGTGNINGDLLTNITNTPVTVTYVYTVTSNGCSANYNVNVVANPMPYQGFAYNQGAWSGIGHWAGGPFSNTQISAQTFVHNINKPVNSVSVILNSIGAVGTFPITATIRTVDVNGIPSSTILGSSTITASFTGGMVNYTFPFASPISLGVGTQYAVVFSMSGGAFPVDGPPSAYDSYPYGYIYLSNDNGSSWYQVANDRDMLFSMTYVETICSNNTFTYNFTSPTVGATATWSRAAVTGITQPASSGTGNISEVLTNTTNSVISVPYTLAITANGCTRNETVYVNVNPTPALSSTLTPAAVCSNSAFAYVPASTTQLTSGSYGFSWTRAAVTGISQVASSGSGSINEVLTNTTFLPVTVTYVYTITANGCSATNNVTVVVNPSPIIAAKTNNACSGVAITLAPVNGSGDVVPTGTTYTWTVVDNPNVIGETNANTAQTSIAQTLVNNYTSAQQVVYTVTPTFNGCAGTPFTYTVTVSTPVTVAALTGATNVCLGATTQLASATAGGVWTSSNTAVATISATGVVTGLTTGTTTVSYTVTNSVGCTGVVTANVNVNALPVATITPSGSTTICQGASVTLTASAGSSYLWSNGLQTASITVTTAGNYSVQVTNAAGCATTSAVTAVVVNPLPTATITANGPTTFCQGGSVTLTASAGSSYLWSNGATTSSITVNASGCYSVTVTNANGCSATSACTQITVNALPVASISSLNGNTFCQGGSVTLVSTPGSIYAWSNNLTTQSINVTASANLTVTVTNAAGCSATSAPFAVTMNALPVATITAGGPLTFCQGGSVTLTAGGGTSYTWANTTSTASSITVTTSGVYTVTATNANGCTATSAPVTVTVNALPVVAAIAGSNDVCVGSTTILTNATTSGVWSSSNTTVATVSASGVVTGVAAGTATINYTVTNASGCVTTSSLVINVNALPVNIPIGGPNTVCVGATITNFANPGGVWSSSNVSVATVAQNGIITGVSAGTATISYTITNSAGCSSTVTKVVTVNALPTVAVAANGPLTFCQGGSVTLTASGGTSYAWSNSTATTASITITSSGSYTVTATNANGCFATSAPVVVNVLALPNAAIASTGSNICLGSTTTLTASGGVSYAWSNGAQTASTTVNNSNTYTVTVTGANGCTATVSNVVTVNANPAVVVTASAPLTFCQGGSVTLNATGAATYVWSNGTLGSSNVITQSGTYYAQGTNAAGCTSNSAVITVTVLPTPVVAALTGSNTVCEASTITLSSATPGGVWSTSNSFIATVNNAGVITGMNAGTAVITYTLSNGACNASVSASVTVLNSPATPVITAGGPTTVCPNETVQLFSSNAPNYQWNSGPQTNNILVTQSGSYTVTVVGSNGCAVTSLPMTVTIGDDVAPIIVAPINVNVNPNLGCTAVGVALGTPVVSDNCTVASVTNNAPSLFPIGTTTVTWTVTDASGNTATATQLVNVVDQVAPEATAPAHVTVNTNNFCDATGVNLGTPEATDNCTIASIVNDAPASFPIGTTVVTWTITDATGNFTTVTQNVTVVDTEAPVVVLQSAAVQLDANGVGVLSFEAIDNGSSDNCGIAEVSIDQTTFDCSQVGFNTVTVTITDNSGNQSEGSVVINVIASDACGGDDVAGPNVPDAFTPNGNSINDTWVIPGLEGYNTKQMAVYSRYGTLVYYSSAYANDWDGTLMGNGVAVPDGTYYYTLTLDGGKQLSGYVYINRVKQ